MDSDTEVMPDLQLYTWNLNLIVFNSENFSVASFKQEMRQSISQRNHKWTF